MNSEDKFVIPTCLMFIYLCWDRTIMIYNSIASILWDKIFKLYNGFYCDIFVEFI